MIGIYVVLTLLVAVVLYSALTGPINSAMVPGIVLLGGIFAGLVFMIFRAIRQSREKKTAFDKGWAAPTPEQQRAVLVAVGLFIIVLSSGEIITALSQPDRSPLAVIFLIASGLIFVYMGWKSGRDK